MFLRFNSKMKSEDLRKVVVRMTNDGMSSVQIAKQLRKVVSERTVRHWQHLYWTTGEIDLKAPTGRPKIIRRKSLIRKVKNRFICKNRWSTRTLAKSFDISKRQRTSFAYWARKSLRKKDREKILFTDEKYFEFDGIF
jgi:transposase